jgi:hypothetical protein
MEFAKTTVIACKSLFTGVWSEWLGKRKKQ